MGLRRPSRAAPCQELLAASAAASVSAVAQAVSLKMELHHGGERGMVEAINAHLPQDMRVFDVVRTTKGFDAKASCSKRRYHYLLPSFLLMIGFCALELLVAGIQAYVFALLTSLYINDAENLH